MDISKISTDLGWTPRQSLAAGLLKTVEWYLEHQDWVDVIGNKDDYQDWLNRNYLTRGGEK
jgi:dTDP-glucose 4,6-dehydratase